MSNEDKLLSIAKNGRSTERTYSAYRIDYDSTDSIAELVTVEETDDEGNTVEVSLAESEQTVDDYFTGSLKNPPAGYPGHEAKDAYQRKLLVEDEATRDEVEAALTDATVSHQTEDVSPTQSEKEHIEDYGAQNSLEGGVAMEWKQMLEDLEAGNISPVDVERGRNTHRGTHPGRGKGGPVGNPGNGN